MNDDEEGADIVIVGGGISGASLLFVLARYTDIPRIILLEKYSNLATLNSNSRNNSQTLHFGDIETNYSIEKARETKLGAEMVLRYVRNLPQETSDGLIQAIPKMVLAVGEEEVDLLEDTYLKGGKRDLFPKLKKIGPEKIASVEPFVIRDRGPDERVEALLSEGGYMVDFGALTDSFAQSARMLPGKEGNRKVSILLNEEVEKVEEIGGSSGFRISTNIGRSLKCSFISFDAGSYSLYFAKSLGYGEDLVILLVSGGFYYSREKVLNGKVYRVQKHHIPFAAVHGDPDIAAPGKTRFGPTAEVTAILEKGHPGTIIDTLKTNTLDIDTVVSLEKILGDRDVRAILEKNALCHVPYFGRHAFVENEVRKIVPSLGYNDVEVARNIGGIRPQILNKKKRELELGEAVLRGENVIFNITPSPGASACLRNAERDAAYIVEHLGRKFDRELFAREIGGTDSTRA